MTESREVRGVRAWSLHRREELTKEEIQTMTNDEKVSRMSRALAGEHTPHPFTRRIEELTNSLCAAEIALAELGYRLCKVCRDYKLSACADDEQVCEECHEALKCKDCGEPITDHTEVYTDDVNGLACPEPALPEAPHE